MKRYLLLIPLVFLGCEEMTTKYEPEPNVVAILITNFPRQRVFVSKSFRISEVPDTSDWCGISGAEVKISYDTIVVMFHELIDTPGVYVSESLPVKPAKTYHLEVTYPDDNIVTGETTTPGTFRIIAPTDGDTVGHGQKIEWEESDRAAAYFIYYRADSLYRPEFGDYYWSEKSFEYIKPDTVVTFGTLSRGYGEITIQIWACDSNYYNYYKGRYWWYDSEPRLLDGGLGVFGSFIYTDSISVFTTP